MPLLVDGQIMEDNEIHDLVRMIRHDIEQIAGQFFENRRSRKFRRYFKTEGAKRGLSAERWYIESERHRFEAALPMYYTDTLREDSGIYEPDENVRSRRHQALILIALMSQAKNARSPGALQLTPGTQQFEGDKIENRHIAETYGDDATIH